MRLCCRASLIFNRCLYRFEVVGIFNPDVCRCVVAESYLLGHGREEEGCTHNLAEALVLRCLVLIAVLQISGANHKIGDTNVQTPQTMLRRPSRKALAQERHTTHSRQISGTIHL